MKRRTFLKTVGGAACAAAINSAGTRKASAQSQQSAKAMSRPATPTHGLDDVMRKDGVTNLRIRPPFWYPDGSPPLPPSEDPKQRRQLFHQEIVGMKGGGQLLAFPVEFEYKGLSTKWVLGGSIANPADLAANDPQRLFTQFVRELAIKVRKYNASLYRLRRLHFCKTNPDPKFWPHANPDGGDVKDPVSDGKFDKRRDDAETDWCDVAETLEQFLWNAKTNGYTNQQFPGTVTLQGTDMTAVNGYIVAMRVVVRGRSTSGIHPLEVGGSSSQVSISSPFSSSTP